MVITGSGENQAAARYVPHVPGGCVPGVHLAASGTERLNACGATVGPGPAGHGAAKQEPGAVNAGKTGTAAPQGTAVA
jgi:hypothetical protein